ncbi:chitin synthase chs-2-like [Toxorhynchites rutilus septentrionalis]|uniref:chitin synthase chs-2-like n=1 Tax=Toxorhynchites rutilus septentrionalis TaxID=329112 RepID=UPI002478D414|nr:chitin synthase chs-2-like [Toxorhynchites rutilus septentrionalis]
MKPNANNMHYFSESSDEDDEQTLLIKKVQQDNKLWDSFQDPPVQQTSGSAATREYLIVFVKVLKVFTYIFVFLVTLAAACFSKISFLLMTSNIKEGTKNRFCDVRQPDKQFEAFIPTEQRVGWMWAIIFSFAVPELGTLIRAARICFFKNIPRPSCGLLSLVALMETFHVAGLALLAFLIFPNLDAVKAVMLTNCVCMVPAVLNILSRSTAESKLPYKYAIDVVAVSAQVTGFVVWPMLSNQYELWFIPVAVFLASCHWWENYLSLKSYFRPFAALASIREKLSESRYYMYLFVSALKILLFLAVGISLSGQSLSNFFDMFVVGWGNHTIEVREMEAILNEKFPDLTSITSDLEVLEVFSAKNGILWVTVAHVLCSYFCYIFSKFSCKIHIQSFSMAFPISLTVPVTVTLLLVFCGLREANVCAFNGILPDYLFFRMPPIYYLFDYVINEFSWLWILWLLSQTWITRHLWMPKSDRNASTEKLFVTPMYNSLLVDQGLAMNRRREDQEDFVKKMDMVKVKDTERANEIDARANDRRNDEIKPYDRIPQIFICATMWHETKEELMEFLKSILRLDEDQCARRMAMKHIQASKEDIDPDYYDLETHIFFDDAFVNDKSKCESANDSPLNSYVKTLIKYIEEAALEVYKTRMRIYPPTKIVTPYGGRLIWTLPGRTKMIAHLKDKNKIRHKKRWSQVMYMYYLLGYRIMQLKTSPERKMVIAQNTYLLALDGDIDFQPQAVSLLVDRMKVDPDLGAACGRIHPVGTGPMVWYQIFEYAIGHWLQKATEHVIGCVLCSPGCFSLFRGRALMENSVMKKYTTKSDQARHYVQYDQGEDRWLCTLLLKQKFRVEYSAASDAYTHAPEGFNEFYNQRRRWVPSTIANIFDLLGDAKRVVKTNNSISMPYIIYQSMLMFGTILGPGTIFLMMVGALVAVFRIDLWTSFLWNALPLATFMAICYWAKQKYQLIAAFFISAIYSLVMMAVLVGIVIQVMEDGILAPSSVFFLCVALQIVITGLLHPQELEALPAGLVYYITIPSMYMLLVIYSVFNMNDVSWGTRENPTEAAKPVATQQPPPGKMSKFLGYLRPNDREEDGSINIGIRGLFSCLFCTHPKSSAEKEQIVQVASSLAEINTKLKDLEMKLTGTVTAMRSDDEDDDEMGCLDMHPEGGSSTGVSSPIQTAKNSELEEPEKQINYLPDWLYDVDLRNGDTETISASEEQFWIELIEKYLKPLDLTEKQKDDMKSQLKALRDLAVFAFVMANALFVLVVFLLQLNKRDLHIQWWFNAKNTISFDESTVEITVRREFLELEPIGLVFVFFFGLILVIQFIAMLMHRFGTISQILASTQLNWYCSKKAKDMSLDAELRENAVEIARRLQRPKPQWDEEDLEDDQKAIGRRDTIHRILYQHKNKQDWSNLEANFKRNYYKDGDLNLGGRLTLSRKTLNVLDTRRKSMAEQRKIRKSILRGQDPYDNSDDLWYQGSPGDDDRQRKSASPPEYSTGPGQARAMGGSGFDQPPNFGTKDRGRDNYAYQIDEEFEDVSEDEDDLSFERPTLQMEMTERPSAKSKRKSRVAFA